MSYDLFFRKRSPDQQFGREDFKRFFSRRPFYKVSDSQALYSNEDTGIYFTFDYDEPEDDASEADADRSQVPVAFNINYFRPHVFGLEAEPEVAAFVRGFNLLVSDPQNSGMGEGEYSREGFLSGWNAGNKFGYLAISRSENQSQLFTLPASEIRRHWEWNYARAGRQDRLEVDAFVPTIMLLEMDGRIRTCVAWGDGIPILLPVVDYVIVPRKRLAPRRWFRAGEDIVAFTWQELEPLFRDFHQRDKPTCFELFYNAPPANIEELIRSKAPLSKRFNGIPFDQVLDHELLEEVRR